MNSNRLIALVSFSVIISFLFLNCSSGLNTNAPTTNSVPRDGSQKVTDDVQLQLLNLLKGTYSSNTCYETPNLTGQAVARTLVISDDAQAITNGVSLELFTPDTVVSLQKHYPPYSLPDHGIAFSISSASKNLQIDVTTNLTSTIGWIEAGTGEVNSNITSGYECPSIDFSTSLLAAPDFYLGQVTRPLFSSSGLNVQVICQNAIGGGSLSEHTLNMDNQNVVFDGVSKSFSSDLNLETWSMITSEGKMYASFSWNSGEGLSVARSMHAPYDPAEIGIRIGSPTQYICHVK